MHGSGAGVPTTGVVLDVVVGAGVVVEVVSGGVVLEVVCCGVVLEVVDRRTHALL